MIIYSDNVFVKLSVLPICLHTIRILILYHMPAPLSPAHDLEVVVTDSEARHRRSMLNDTRTVGSDRFRQSHGSATMRQLSGILKLRDRETSVGHALQSSEEHSIRDVRCSRHWP